MTTPDPAATALDPLSMFRLDGRVAIVTGASSGLGERFARVLHAVGATVVLVARREDRLEALASELERSFVVAADLSLEEDRVRVVDATVEEFGRIDLLVNNAGVGEKMALEDEEVDWFRFVMEVNVTALWHLSKLCAPHLGAHDHQGSIVNIASMLGHVGSTPIKEAHYCASKGAVVNLTRELSLQLGRRNVRVNALSPGWFKSEMTGDMDTDPDAQRFISSNAPLQRMGEPHELDGALLLLAGDSGGYMTGHSLLVDGGWTAR